VKRGKKDRHHHTHGVLKKRNMAGKCAAICVAVLSILSAVDPARADCQDEETVFSDSEFKALRIIPAIGSSFSILGATFIVFTYFYIPKLQRGHYKLIACMSFADGMAALSVLLGVGTNVDNAVECDTSPFCWFQAMMMTYFELSSIFWVLCISLKLCLAISSVVEAGMNDGVFQYISCLMHGKQHESYEMRVYGCLSWGWPAILTIIAMSTDVFGDTGQWCWIKSDHQWARFGLYYGWLLAIMIAVLFVYSVTMWEANKGLNLSISKPLAFRLRLYLLAFFVTKFFSVINRFHNLAHPSNPNFALNLLQSIFEPFTGFVNASVYGANKMVLREYMLKWNGRARSGSSLGSDEEMPKPRPSHVLRKPSDPSPKDGAGTIVRQNSFKCEDHDLDLVNEDEKVSKVSDIPPMHSMQFAGDFDDEAVEKAKVDANATPMGSSTAISENVDKNEGP